MRKKRKRRDNKYHSTFSLSIFTMRLISYCSLVFPPNVLTHNSELRGCLGDSRFIDSSTGVGSAVCQTDHRDRQSAVDVQAAVAIVTPDSDV